MDCAMLCIECSSLYRKEVSEWLDDYKEFCKKVIEHTASDYNYSYTSYNCWICILEVFNPNA